ILPAQHPVGQQVETGVPLDGDELGKVALDLLVDRLLRGAAAIKIAGRLDELFRARVDPRGKGLHHDFPAAASWFSAALIRGACRARTPISPAAPGTMTISASSSKTAPSGVVSEIENVRAPSATYLKRGRLRALRPARVPLPPPAPRLPPRARRSARAPSR